MMTMVDFVNVRPAMPGDPDLIPIDKLGSFLRWRESEFVEKYKDVYFECTDDKIYELESDMWDGTNAVIHVKPEVIFWPHTASHQWVAAIEVNYYNFNEKRGLAAHLQPILQQLEDEVAAMIKIHGACIYLANHQENGKHLIFIACNEFRKISRLIGIHMQKITSNFSINFSVHKDKYWTVLDLYRPAFLNL